VLDEAVGQVQCTLSPEETAYVLDCSHQQSAYEADTGRNVTYGKDVDERLSARWQHPGLHLVSVDRRAQTATISGETTSRTTTVVVEADAVEVTTHRDSGAPEKSSYPLESSSSPLSSGRPLKPVVLESSEWPWRLSALPFSDFYSAQATMVDANAQTEEAGVAVATTSVVVYGAEPIKTPAGTYITWQVRVGDQLTAWYDVERPHTLVALDNGVESWVLTFSE
jgi:hypothetical protein